MRICSFEDCDKKHKAKGFCDTHYKRSKKGNIYSIKNSKKTDFCKKENCSNKYRSLGFCRKHRDEFIASLNNKSCLGCNKISIYMKELCYSCYHKISEVKNARNKSNLKWRKNSGKGAYYSQIINSKKLNAIPKWLNDFQISEIHKMYELCPEGCEVDHIIPLNHKDVQGLHVPWNLQYLPKKQNRLKTNKFDYTYNNDSWKNIRS